LLRFGFSGNLQLSNLLPDVSSNKALAVDSFQVTSCQDIKYASPSVMLSNNISKTMHAYQSMKFPYFGHTAFICRRPSKLLNTSHQTGWGGHVGWKGIFTYSSHSVLKLVSERWGAEFV